jgi:hypothetical protein
MNNVSDTDVVQLLGINDNMITNDETLLGYINDDLIPDQRTEMILNEEEVVIPDHRTDMILNEDEVVSEEVDETFTSEEYTNIAKACWEVCRLLKHKSCDNFLETLIGFRLITLRSETGTPYTSMTRNMIPTSLTKNILELFSSANGEVQRVKKQYVSETTETEVVECLQEEEPKNNVMSKKRQTCCCCKQTNRYDKSLRFTKVPKTKIVIYDKSNDNSRFNFYAETFRRKVYLYRFGLSKHTKNSKYLLYCSNHRLQSETFTIVWKNSLGIQSTKVCKLVVPVDKKAPKLPPTRANRLLIHSPPTSVKRKSCSHLPINSSTENTCDEDNNPSSNDSDNKTVNSKINLNRSYENVLTVVVPTECLATWFVSPPCRTVYQRNSIHTITTVYFVQPS